MITKISLWENLEQQYKVERETNTLPDLNKLNIFIGANNTGKSRFLRALFTAKDFKFELSELDSAEIGKVFKDIAFDLEKLLDRRNIEDVSGTNIAGLKKTLQYNAQYLNGITLTSVNQAVNDILHFISRLKVFEVSNAEGKPGYISSGAQEALTISVNTVLEKYYEILSELIPEKFSYSPERVYIPILRGLRPTQFNIEDKFNELEDNYSKRTIRDYFKENPVKEGEIFTGLRLYHDTKNMLLGKREERDKIRDFEKFLSQTFFNNAPLTLIPNIEDDSLHVSIGEEEWPIYKLGDGIQSIIILLYPLFFNQGKNMLVFIEEPENSMHPGLQRLFIETILQKRFNTFQYFITTHSNHFLDITLDESDISVYSFRKAFSKSTLPATYLIDNASNEDNNVLELIGARNSSVFLSNCTIWVEGITDRLYLKKYLEVYQNNIYHTEKKTKFREDFNYSFVEYGGSNITHWTFDNEAVWDKIKANKISSKIFLVADKDSTDIKSSSKKAKRLETLNDILKNNFQIVNGKEIENILKPSVLIKAIQALEKDNSINLDYNESKILKANYLNKPLGQFISTSFKNLKRRYAAESGTIFCKLDFCKAAIANIQDIDDLSPEVLSLVKSIYNFIEQSNPVPV